MDDQFFSMYWLLGIALLCISVVAIFPATASADICGITHDSEHRITTPLGAWRDGELVHHLHRCPTTGPYLYETAVEVVIRRSDSEQRVLMESIGLTDATHSMPMRLDADSDRLVTPSHQYTWSDDESEFMRRGRDDVAPRGPDRLARSRARFDGGEELAGLVFSAGVDWQIEEDRRAGRVSCRSEVGGVVLPPDLPERVRERLEE